MIANWWGYSKGKVPMPQMEKHEQIIAFNLIML
jgi:hypothetical protein